MPSEATSIEVDVASRLRLPADLVSRILDEATAELHRRIRSYRGMNGDYIGEALRFELPARAYFHLLGFVQVVTDRYAWDEHTSAQYLERAGIAEDWKLLSQEVAAWPQASPLAPIPANLQPLLAHFIATSSECAQQMMTNADYIRNELPTVQLDSALMEQVVACCDELVGTKHDIVSELFELQDLAQSTSLGVLETRVLRIRSWLSDPIPRLHELVQSLDPAHAETPTNTLAFILISESATNILRAYAAMAESADRFLISLSAKLGSAG